jgi:hypothetical protein
MTRGTRENREREPDLRVFEFREIGGTNYEPQGETHTRVVAVHDPRDSRLVFEPTGACAGPISAKCKKPFRSPRRIAMKSTTIRVAMLGVFLFFAPVVWAQTPASGNQSAASPAPSASAAEVPRLIRFSGTLLDAQDRPMAGPVGVTFALHAQQSGGAALWLETQNVTPDAHGNYTVLLGANSANGVPAELFASGEARWLEVQVERQAEQPRILLVSVPYALKAKDAETLGGKPASAFALLGPGAALLAGAMGTSAAPAASTGGTPQPAALCPNVTSDGTATANSISKFTAACAIQNSAITESAGNVGIGTTAPIRALDIEGGTNTSVLVRGPGTHNVQLTGDSSSGRLGQDLNGFFFASDTNGRVIKFLTNNGALNEWMRITSAGNVGIGTSTPAQKLSVAGMIESTSGGYKFPNGTVQTTAGGTGTLTSVGSGLGLTGGPITSSGTLAIDPLVVPQLGAASNTFTGGVNAAGLTATNLANPIVATMTGNTAQTAAVTGTATATGIGNTYGVAGYSSTSNAVGVFGQANSGGTGLYGLSTGGVGVFGTGSAYGFQTDSNVNQARTAGGWVKGMVFVNAWVAPYTIVRCFNSTLAGAAATTPPCGFGLTENSLGDFTIDFGFQVDDRFYSGTISRTTITGASIFVGTTAPRSALDVQTYAPDGTGLPAYYSLIVY